MPRLNESTCHFCQARLPAGVHERFCSDTCARSYVALEPVAAAEARVNQAWALQDGRTLDAYDAALARIDAALAQVAAVKAQTAPPPPPPAEDLTAAVTAIWDRYEQDVRWAVARRKCGDRFRAETGMRGAWARCERAFAALGDAPANTNRGRPELRLVAGEHPIVGATVCVTCEHRGVLADGRPCQLCGGAGVIAGGEHRDASERPLLTDSSEEPTAVEVTEADADRYMEARHEARVERGGGRL